ncbi:hypothetical protein ACF1AJ_19380 [Leifsonia sp. NPDC014704]|uniref:Uncharacterized protein n=1 Tax=Leifsonia virtsii TaxID=3035915 RepID=A0ABT8J2H4_9MICO|nr:hypothetical protein [Leifsonia virtsii]MDN4599284.1 hypothetical protein [Leifsonia virtsii]
MNPDAFRAAVAALGENPTAFLNSAQLIDFLDHIRRHLIPNAINLAQKLGHPYQARDEDDLVNLILVSFATSPEQCRALVENAASPFAYAASLVREWIGIETGRPRLRQRVAVDREIHPTGRKISQRPQFDWLENPELRIPHSSFPDPASYGTREGATIDEAVDLTVATLEPRTPAKLAKHLPDVVGWMADNPSTRQGHEGERIAEAAELFSPVSTVELRAVANISWGGRPNPQETSLLYAFLTDRDFNPRKSETHLSALRVFQGRVRQESVLAGVADFAL